MRVAVVSDTHGLLRPAVLPHLEGAETIIHAGDVGDAAILETLSRIAPTHAVRGNVDKGDLAASLPSYLRLELSGAVLEVVHDLADWIPPEGEARPRLVVFGHSHKPAFYAAKGIQFLNPGAIGPRRFKLPISFALLEWRQESFTHRFVDLENP